MTNREFRKAIKSCHYVFQLVAFIESVQNDYVISGDSSLGRKPVVKYFVRSNGRVFIFFDSESGLRSYKNHWAMAKGLFIDERCRLDDQFMVFTGDKSSEKEL